MSNEYDSIPDTKLHIVEVQRAMRTVMSDLAQRAYQHDQSKLENPELSVFNEYTPKLKNAVYGSDEYKSFLTGMGEALKHHYAVNDHHPEHFPNGISGMNLMQLTEMLCDWVAAVKRTKDGDVRRSIEINRERFGYGDEIAQLLLNTVESMGV